MVIYIKITKMSRTTGNDGQDYGLYSSIDTQDGEITEGGEYLVHRVSVRVLKTKITILR